MRNSEPLLILGAMRIVPFRPAVILILRAQLYMRVTIGAPRSRDVDAKTNHGFFIIQSSNANQYQKLFVQQQTTKIAAQSLRCHKKKSETMMRPASFTSSAYRSLRCLCVAWTKSAHFRVGSTTFYFVKKVFRQHEALSLRGRLR